MLPGHGVWKQTAEHRKSSAIHFHYIQERANISTANMSKTWQLAQKQQVNVPSKEKVQHFKDKFTQKLKFSLLTHMPIEGLLKFLSPHNISGASAFSETTDVDRDLFHKNNRKRT